MKLINLFCVMMCSVISCSKARADGQSSNSPPVAHKQEQGANTTAVDASIPSKCPAEMAEVKGNYCPNVEETCLKWDEKVVNVNGKVRCLSFGPSKCLSAKREFLHFCMDKYEYQKDKTDPLPTVMVSFYDMQKLAKKEDKRLCYDYEWTFACMGEEMRPYPTGWTRPTGKCNIDKPWIPFDAQALGSNDPAIRDAEVQRISQRVPANANPDCASPFGILNMIGNVDEILINSNSNVSHKNTLKGGHWAIGARNRCTPRTDAHNEEFSFYEVGGRLCKDIK